ncbi:uncharacterized protein LOC110774155 isoform X1 [Prunus avium]|uniref:Uncharacterized protein LOC110774155 isoform X1 n=1 Tax=Prunus avium TaxID=42229 RepID=A0A6P5U542_PRUAV|nr:uncharacterized protein LOC110774155 isoform X1 [Prunus avium]
MKHISLSPSTEFAEIAISIASFSPPSSPRSVHRTRLVRQNLFSPSENEPSSSTNLKGKTPSNLSLSLPLSLSLFSSSPFLIFLILMRVLMSDLVMIGSRTLCNGLLLQGSLLSGQERVEGGIQQLGKCARKAELTHTSKNKLMKFVSN